MSQEKEKTPSKKGSISSQTSKTSKTSKKSKKSQEGSPAPEQEPQEKKDSLPPVPSDAEVESKSDDPSRTKSKLAVKDEHIVETTEKPEHPDEKKHIKISRKPKRSVDDDGNKSRDTQTDRDAEFDPKKHKKPTAVQYHEYNDLSKDQGVQYRPQNAIRTHGPGVTPEIEHLYGPCTLLMDFQYTTWANTIVPLRNHNMVQGFNEMALYLIKLAASGSENMSHEEAFLAASFLSNIRNDLGEVPPNVLSLLEHIDFKTRDDETPQPDSKFVYLG